MNHEERAFCDVLERAKTHKGKFMTTSSGTIRHKTIKDGCGYPACPFVVAAHDMGKPGVFNTNVAKAGELLFGYPPAAMARIMQAADSYSAKDRAKLVAACL